MPHALGIDIGSVAVKLALVDPEGKLLGVWSRPIVRLPAEALASLIAEISVETGWKSILQRLAVRIGVTGDGCELIRGPVLRETAVVALTRAVPAPLPRRSNGDRDRRALGPLRGDRTADAHAAGLRPEPAVRRRIGLLLRATGHAAGPRRGGVRRGCRPARREGQPSPAGAACSRSRT